VRNLGETMKAFIILIVVGFCTTGYFAAVWLADHLHRKATQSPLHMLGHAAAVLAFTAMMYGVFRTVMKKRELDAIEFIFVIGAAVALAGAYWLVQGGEHYAAFLARAGFVVFVTILPCALFYLFVSTKRDHILSDYLTNVQALGLTERINGEDDAILHGRIGRCLERLEAAYGTILDDSRTSIIKTVASGHLPPTGAGQFGIDMRVMLPVVWVTALCALGWWIALPPVAHESPAPEPVVYAFLGAYWLSLMTLFWRYYRRDLLPVAYLAMAKRIVLGVIGAWVVTKALSVLPQPPDAKGSDTILLLVCFGVGAFPAMAWEFITAVFRRLPGVDVALPSLKDQLPVGEIDGLNALHQARLEEEDISSVQNLATANLLELLANTRFSTGRLIDWIDQAIVLSIIKAEDAKETLACRQTLRALGIHTATDLHDKADWLKLDSTRLTTPSTICGQQVALRDWIISLDGAARNYPNTHLVARWREHAINWRQNVINAAIFAVPKPVAKQTDNQEASGKAPASS
jgi:hypothetical protein